MRPLVIGHRGAMALAPENTLASFELALAQGADGVECDVHLTRDGQVVVMHDFSLERTTNGKGAIAEKTLSDLAELDAGSWFGSEFVGERVPTLDQFLAVLQREAARREHPPIAVIELKAGSGRYPGIEKAVVEAVRRAQWSAHTVLISFDHVAIQETKRLAPEISAGILYHAAPIDAPAMARAALADVLGPSRELLNAEAVERAQASGLQVFVWTALTPAHARQLAAMGVEAFGANHPQEALAALLPEEPTKNL